MRWIQERMGWAKPEGRVIHPEDLDWDEAEVHEGREVGMLYRGTLTTYSLRILVPPVPYEEREHVHSETDQDKRVLADLPALLEHAEEQIEKALPDGYQVRITEWDK